MLKFDDGGLRNVWLTNGYQAQSAAYGKGYAYHDLDGLVHAICKALTRKAGRLTGAEFRYLRSHLGIKRRTLSLDIEELTSRVAKVRSVFQTGNRLVEVR